jgi:hypothetical protein
MKTLSSKHTRTYFKAIELILNHLYKYHSLSGAALKNSNTQNMTNTISLLNGKKDKKEKEDY